MRAFAAVVDAGSFVRAAEASQVSKTAVSRLVGELERGWACACCIARPASCR
jgi:DNA-binding transcriptional LysR family regulator